MLKPEVIRVMDLDRWTHDDLHRLLLEAAVKLEEVQEKLDEQRRLRFLSEEHYRLARDGRREAHEKLDKLKKSVDEFDFEDGTGAWHTLNYISGILEETIINYD